ncbi:hypothetical protein BRADI_5g16513v3 [Brachypodium distachyon]|uniref:Uncharacterized protein n=1 Tax=Brachypodium distachyon TaxID=15368 RepID=A0A2K2CHN1_BRADI|nr:hypothetical protein BRADI_5g16513v3 [Brachypodium distachyon]
MDGFLGVVNVPTARGQKSSRGPWPWVQACGQHNKRVASGDRSCGNVGESPGPRMPILANAAVRMSAPRARYAQRPHISCVVSGIFCDFSSFSSLRL